VRPADRVLHPDLAKSQVLTGLCQRFNFSAWAIETGRRLADGTASDEDRDARGRYIRGQPSLSIGACELITGTQADDPWRVGKPLHGPYEGLHAARCGTYRILYKIDESKRAIEIRSIRHRADAYRT